MAAFALSYENFTLILQVHYFSLTWTLYNWKKSRLENEEMNKKRGMKVKPKKTYSSQVKVSHVQRTIHGSMVAKFSVYIQFLNG